MSPPPLPTADLEDWQLWPLPAARDVIAKLERVTMITHRTDLTGARGRSDGSGAADLTVLKAGSWCLKTSPRRCYAEQAAAVDALQKLAQRKVALGLLLPPGTALALQPDRSGSLWLWSISRWLVTLRAAMSEAVRRGDEGSLGAALCRYADCAVIALRLAAERRLLLDVHPSNFALRHDALYYVDDDIAIGESLAAIGHALLHRVLDYADHQDAVERYLSHLEWALHARFSRAEMRSLGLDTALTAVPTRHAVVKAAQRRLLDGLHQRAKTRTSCR